MGREIARNSKRYVAAKPLEVGSLKLRYGTFLLVKVAIVIRSRFFSSLVPVLLVCGPVWALSPTNPARAQFQDDEQTTINIYNAARPAVVTIGNRNGAGTGTFIDPSGLILTNEHVVRGSRQVQVMTADGNRYTGQVLQIDNVNDLALVRVSADEEFPTIPFAAPENIQVGQRVYAIGNPFGLEGTFTTGILSRIGNNGDLQTDAAINPGNSGGPLLNSLGELIGVNKAILSPGGQGNIGIGFATSAPVAQTFIASLENGNGSVAAAPPNTPSQPSPNSRPRLGVSVDANSLIVQKVEPGSIAERLRIQPGDRILAVNGTPLRNLNTLIDFLDTSPNSAVLTLGRGRQL
ncbi:MAG: trypsin-like peptidase domain-containing protein, partial [Cyanobacteria bacterium J06555_12]